MKRTTNIGAITLLALVLNGCAFANVSCRSGMPYSGTFSDTYGVVKPTINPIEWLVVKPLDLIDLPFTFILDTIFLPFFIL